PWAHGAARRRHAARLPRSRGGLGGAAGARGGAAAAGARGALPRARSPRRLHRVRLCRTRPLARGRASSRAPTRRARRPPRLRVALVLLLGGRGQHRHRARPRAPRRRACRAPALRRLVHSNRSGPWLSVPSTPTPPSTAPCWTMPCAPAEYATWWLRAP